LKAGRGAAYGENHKARLEEIRNLQAKGMMLAEIGHMLALEDSREHEKGAVGLKTTEVGRMVWFGLDGSVEKDCRDLQTEGSLAEPALALPKHVAWRSYSIADDAVVMFKAETSPWRTKRLLAALRRFAAEVKVETKREDRGD
jgi:DNA-binding transcriptional MerR regulator